MNKRGMFILTMILLLLALTFGAAISASHISPEQVEGIKENFTIDELNMSFEGLAPELENAFNYYVNGLLNAYEELVKWTMGYTAKNPDVPYKLLLYLFLLAIFAPIIMVLFKLIVIIYLLLREWSQSRTEKKLLRRLENISKK